MPQLPDDLSKRASAIKMRHETLAKELLGKQIAERQTEAADSNEALRLGRHYAGMLRAAGIVPVNIYDNVPLVTKTSLLKIGDSYSYANSSMSNKSHDEIDQLLEPTGRGWIVSHGCDHNSEGWPHEWSYGISDEGEALQSFKQGIDTGNNSSLLNGRKREFAKGVIIRPERMIGTMALRHFNNERFLDGLAWVLDGNEPLEVAR